MPRKTYPLSWLVDLLFPPAPARTSLPPELKRACDLLAAIDAGGVPLNPIRVNQIARQLGLEVSTKAPVEETIGRIRTAVAHQLVNR